MLYLLPTNGCMCAYGVYALKGKQVKCLCCSRNCMLIPTREAVVTLQNKPLRQMLREGKQQYASQETCLSCNNKGPSGKRLLVI